MLLHDLEIFRDQQIKSEVSRKSRLRSRYWNILLEDARRLKRKAGPVFQMRVNLDLLRQGVCSPEEKAVGNLVWHRRIHALADDWKGIVAQVRATVAEISARLLPHIRKEELSLQLRANPGR